MEDLQKWFLEHASDDAADKSLGELISGFEDDDYTLSAEAFNRFCSQVGKGSGRPVFFRPLQRIAAVLLLPFVVATAFLALRKPAGSQWNEVYTQSGQSRSVTLPDGSLIRLAPESHILYPSSFPKGSRQVFLQGEAYADIVHKDGCPFRIQSQEITVTVFGTEFNFSSYQGDSECELALVDGSVEMKIHGRDADHTIQMKTGDLVRYQRGSGSIEKQRFSADTYLANAKRDGLQFSNRKFGDISRTLERKFGAKIIIEDPSLAEERFFAAFINGEDLPTILESFNTQNHMNINKKGSNYYLSLK
ncbi:MAG: FecR domain-containing protein [Bacteroidales bacterium]|nr:FecR domain-containing protein [Bacteroidales bacterium]